MQQSVERRFLRSATFSPEQLALIFLAFSGRLLAVDGQLHVPATRAIDCADILAKLNEACKPLPEPISGAAGLPDKSGDDVGVDVPDLLYDQGIY